MELKELLDSGSVTATPDGWRVVHRYRADIAEPSEAVLQSNVPDPGDPHPVFRNQPDPEKNLYATDIKAKPGDHRYCYIDVTYTAKTPDTKRNKFGEIWEWNFATETVHANSTKTPFRQQHYPTDDPSAQTGSAIGVTDDGVEGVDILSPVQTLTVRKPIPESELEDALHVIHDLQAKVNASPWFWYAAESALFEGGRIYKTDQYEWEVALNFRSRRVEDTLSYLLIDGTSVEITDVKPHDYVWLKTVQKPDDEGDLVETGIESVHVARVYDRGDFARFGLQGPKYDGI